jgi:DNA-binding NtrC family response regulator
VQASVLLVSDDEVLSQSRSLLLQQWSPVVLVPDVAPAVMAARRWDLLVLCQTVEDDVAASLAEQMTTLHPNTMVMAINNTGQIRNFR